MAAMARRALSPFLRVANVPWTKAARSASVWSGVEQGPPDAIFGLVEAFNKDTNPSKVSLVVGAYRDDNGKPYVLPVVKKVERTLVSEDLNKEYAGMTGVPEFVQASVALAFTNDSPAVVNKTFAAAQAISGTGALRLGAVFLHKFYPHEKVMYISSPSWANHTPIFKHSGFDVKTYRYYDAETSLTDFDSMCEDLNQIPEHSLVLLHACAHNPTGCDLNQGQWTELSQLFKRQRLFPFFDLAYQGYATGDVNRDAFAVRKFAEDGHQMVLAQSYAKNMGLYGERVGCLTVLTGSEAEAKAVESQLKILIRPLYSNPPVHGARIAKEILTTPDLYAEWKTRGRLKVCSHSLVYDPLDFSYPVLKLAFKDCEAISEYSDRLQLHLNNTFKKKDHSSLFYVQTKKHCCMLQNGVISPFKFVKTKHSFLFCLNFGDLAPVLRDLGTFYRASQLTPGERDTVTLDALKQRYSKFSFNISWLEELQEKIVLQMAGEKVTPMVANPGRILLTSHRLYFQPFNDAEMEPVLKLHLAELRRVVRRRYILRHVGIELITRSGETMFLVFEDQQSRDRLYTHVLKQSGVVVEELDLEELTRQWQWGQMSNYDYIMALNFLADRSLNDITQYPVFPWVIADYSSGVLDLTNPATFRDLSKPIGALNEERLEGFKERYDESPGKKFLYGTHYSAPAFVLYYLVRTAPEYLLCLQNGHFDHPNRMFHSIASTWKNVLTSATDVKELIPEFFEPPGNFLLNTKNLDMGTRSSGEKLGHVILPPWAKDAHDFTVKCREALECQHVSDHLHLWIDLIFGFKQRGEESIKADNVFHYLTYEGEVDLETVTDPTELTSFKVQIREFGQTPKQLFFTPHPSRTCGREEPTDQLPTPQLPTPQLPRVGIDSPVSSQQTPSTPSRLPPNDAPPPPASARLSWDTLSVCHQQKLHKEAITGVKFAPDSLSVFTTSKDKNLKMFSVDLKEVTAQANLADLPLSCVAVLPDSKTVLVGCWDNYIYAYSIEYGAKLTSVYAHDSSVSCMHLRDSTLVSGSWDSAVKVWAVSTSGSVTLSEVAEFDHEGEVSCVSLDPSCRMVAAGSAEGSVVIWNIDTQEELTDTRNIHSGPVHALAFMEDGEVVVTSGADCMLCQIRVHGGASYINLQVPDVFRCFSLHHDYVIAGGSRGVLHVWSLATQQEVFRKQAHSGPISCVDVFGEMEWVVTGSEDRTIAIWKL